MYVLLILHRYIHTTNLPACAYLQYKYLPGGRIPKYTYVPIVRKSCEDRPLSWDMRGAVEWLHDLLIAHGAQLVDVVIRDK